MTSGMKLYSVFRQLSITVTTIRTDIPKQIRNFSSVFVNLRNLENLEIQTSGDDTRILYNDTFQPLSHLPIQTLKIRFCLSAVEPLAFSWFSQLSTLDLSFTTCMSVADLYPAWIGLSKTKIKVLNLKYFGYQLPSPILTFRLIILNSTFFENMNFEYLTEFNLEYTFIQSVDEWKFSSKAKQLKKLCLPMNHLNPREISLLVTRDLYKMDSLEFLDLSGQFVRWDDTSYLLFLPPNLKTLNMTSIEIRQTSPTMWLHLNTSRKLENFCFANNYIKTFSMINIVYPNPNVSFSADLSSNKLVTFYPDPMQGSIARGLRVGKLFLSNNELGGRIKVSRKLSRTTDIWKL